jgi:HupH hydrogenase expression protein, C-terminal conserved region
MPTETFYEAVSLITDFPALAKAQPEDIEDSIARIDEVINGQSANVARSLPVLPS